MIDNFIKTILLTPEVMYDTTVGEMGSEDIQKVFKSYEKLDNISASNLLRNNGRISFIEVPNSLFDFIVSKLTIEEGTIRLTTLMHVDEENRKIILCLSYERFQKNCKEYKLKLEDKRDHLLREINRISEELITLSKLDITLENDKEVEE